jgi:hypothetical protein
MKTDLRENGAAWNNNDRLFTVRAINYSPIRKRKLIKPTIIDYQIIISNKKTNITNKITWILKDILEQIKHIVHYLRR